MSSLSVRRTEKLKVCDQSAEMVGFAGGDVRSGPSFPPCLVQQARQAWPAQAGGKPEREKHGLFNWLVHLLFGRADRSFCRDLFAEIVPVAN